VTYRLKQALTLKNFEQIWEIEDLFSLGYKTQNSGQILGKSKEDPKGQHKQYKSEP
jgi:hypothetical protein